jgi:hypothetical protein
MSVNVAIGPSALGGVLGDGDISITYYVEVVGPKSVTVPLDLTASASTAASGQSTASVAELAFVSLQLNACTNGDGPAECAALGNPGSSFSGTQIVDVPSNTAELLVLEVTCDTYDSCSASIDSMVVIDSSFTEKGYRLVFSPAE